jgi:hypothetical protein
MQWSPEMLHPGRFAEPVEASYVLGAKDCMNYTIEIVDS